VKRFWLHQANLSMNHLIVKKLLGREATVEEAPVILDTYANTSSAGSVIAFHKYQDDLPRWRCSAVRRRSIGRDSAQALIRSVA
jgi:beta-ketodecanoyl-[acyl-carrier-protein] synthase